MLTQLRYSEKGSGLCLDQDWTLHWRKNPYAVPILCYNHLRLNVLDKHVWQPLVKGWRGVSSPHVHVFLEECGLSQFTYASSRVSPADF